ncbi:hypothetical protein F4777DRAFT_309301 [Nemania sp. FL0916]|nr:hypothetical protein F4777DRAFT_309301 [Nemania sp. FL0916]
MQLWEKSKAAAATTWARTSRRWRILSLLLGLAGATAVYAYVNLHLHHRVAVAVPRLRLEYNSMPSSSFGPQHGHGSGFNASKLALLIEDRALANLAPLILHFIAVVPADWRFRFMGSLESLAFVNRSHAVRVQVGSGKLDLQLIPGNMSTGSQELISRFLTKRWLYETLLAPAEWLLVFQTDSILCANSRQNLNDFLDYDWVGAPWDPNGRFGGNGGLSLRRVSAILSILRQQSRADNSEPEDVWLTERLGHRPGARMANGSLSLAFSGEMHAGPDVQIYHHHPAIPPASKAKNEGENEDGDGDGGGENGGYYIDVVDDWRDGFYEPMGYHTGGSGTTLHGGIWGSPRLRRHIWNYCPEIKMTLAMDVAKYVPGDCIANWKRHGEGVDRGSIGIDDFGYGTEIIDGAVYPMLPPGLVPW